MTTKKNTHNRAHTLFKKEVHVLAWLAAFVIILLITNAFTVQRRFNTITEKNAAATPQANQNVGVMQFGWVDSLSTGPGMYQPNDDFKVVGVRVQLLNLQNKDVWFAPNLESYITNSKGEKYRMVVVAVNNPFPAGIYAPQTAATGELAYAIPKRISDPQWCYELAAVNGGGAPVCIALNKYSQKQSL